jgi:uncharacterized protein YjbI with pentapeptide repeats
MRSIISVLPRKSLTDNTKISCLNISKDEGALTTPPPPINRNQGVHAMMREAALRGAELCDKLLQVVLSSRVQADINTAAAANAMQVLVAANAAVFYKLDLSEVRIAGADLSYGSFCSVDFS